MFTNGNNNGRINFILYLVIRDSAIYLEECEKISAYIRTQLPKMGRNDEGFSSQLGMLSWIFSKAFVNDPNFDGFLFIRDLSEKFPSSRFVVLSFDEDSFFWEIWENGCYHYEQIDVPEFDPRKLVKA